MDTGALDISQTHYVVEGVDEEGYLTGQLPIKIVDEKPDFQDMESRRRMEHSEDEISQTETGEIKIKYNPEKHILLEEAKTKNKSERKHFGREAPTSQRQTPHGHSGRDIGENKFWFTQSFGGAPNEPLCG